MNPNNILLMTNANGAVPSRLSTLDRSPMYGGNGMLKIFRDQLETIAKEKPQTPACPTITAAFAEVVQNIYDNNGYPVQN